MTNEEFLREGYRLLNEERRIAPAMYADDFVLTQSDRILGTRGTFYGAGGMQAAIAELLEGLDEVYFEPLEFEHHGDWVIVLCEWGGSVRGVRQSAKVFHLWRMRDGLAASLRVLISRADAHELMEQAGQA